MRSPTTIAIVVLMIVSGPLVSATRAQGPNRADGGASAASQSSSKTADASASPATILAEIIKALAWPVSALIMAVVFRRPLNAFLGALGTRVNKLSVFKVELELTPAKSATSTPLLDEIRAVTTAAPIADSAATLLEQVQMATPADYATIHLGHGDEWLTSRLFIAATMLERMRGLQVLVFVESVDTIDRRLLAVVPVAVVRWALARRYPYLEAAWASAYLHEFPASLPASAPALPQGAVWLPDPLTLVQTPPLVKSDSGGMESWVASQVANRLIMSLQRPTGATPSNEPGWVLVQNGTKEERADWVSGGMLRDLLPAETFTAWSEEWRDAPRSKRSRGVLRRRAPFVALTQGDREFVRLVNRKAFVEDIIAPLAEEPESAA